MQQVGGAATRTPTSIHVVSQASLSVPPSIYICSDAEFHYTSFVGQFNSVAI